MLICARFFLEFISFKWLTPVGHCSTPAHSQPAFTSEEVVDKILDLQDKVSVFVQHHIAICSYAHVSATTCQGSYYNITFVMQVASINRIPKPKPKIEKKPTKEEEPANKEKTASSESASSETESTGTSQESNATEGDQSASPENSDSEPQSHDEL